jgi:pilus assembly protein Flp/PilA
MIAMIKKFAADQNGATAIEYGLIAALISVVIIGVLTTVGSNLLRLGGDLAALSSSRDIILAQSEPGSRRGFLTRSWTGPHRSPRRDPGN